MSVYNKHKRIKTAKKIAIGVTFKAFAFMMFTQFQTI